MKTRRWFGILFVIALAIALFFIPEENQVETERKLILNDEEFIQEEFVENREEGLVNRFLEPQILFESEDICIRLIRLLPKEGFRATVEVAVETNIEEEFSLYVTTRVDDGETEKVFAQKQEEPIYQKEIIEEVYEDGIRVEENKIVNPESYEEFYFRYREYLTESVDYKFKEIYEFNIAYDQGDMEANSLFLSMQLLYSSRIETAVNINNRIDLFSNDAIVERKKEPLKYDEVTSFLDFGREIIEVGNNKYVLEHNKLYLRGNEEEEGTIIYVPNKRGHYILEYYVGETCIYFLEEVPGEEIDYPDPYKKYARLLVMERDGTNVTTLLDGIECDWFYIPSLYVYENVLYMYDWDFLRAYQLDKYGEPESVVFVENSIYANISSGSLVKYDLFEDAYNFYGLPFWLNRVGYLIASSESGEVIIKKNEEWETIAYYDESAEEMRGFYRDQLEAVSKEHLLFRVVDVDGMEKILIFDLEENLVEGVLALPNGNENCVVVYTDEYGVYFQKNAENRAIKQQIYYYDFESKSVNKSNKKID